MDAVALTARFVLVVLFLLAAVGKLLDRDGTRDGLREFGIPARLVPAVALALPAAELAVAASLLPARTAHAGALAAACLLAAFTGAIGAARLRGRQMDCHCFGALHSTRAGAGALLRNGGLVASAAIVAAVPARPFAWWHIAVAVGAALVVLQAWAWFELLRRHGRLLAAQAAPATVGVGAAAPNFALPSLGGDLVTLPSLAAAGAVVQMVFLEPGCGPCRALLAELGRRMEDPDDGIRTVLAFSGDEDAVSALAREHGVDPGAVIVDSDGELARAYGVDTTPSSVLLAPNGTLAAAAAVGAGAIDAQLRELPGHREDRASRRLAGVR